ncbi:MAG: nuclear transport factor 2 family protein [Pseudomonadota bacterium]
MARAVRSGIAGASALWVALALGAASCAPDAERAEAAVAPSGEAADVVTGLMQAFNDHDPEKMRTFWHEDVVWYEISGGATAVITSDAQQLYDELVVYFKTFPSVSSSIDGVAVNGRFVSAIERPVWEEDGERQTQASNVVYEIVDGKVKRFWYYPPQS